jgi:hypothetical protein
MTIYSPEEYDYIYVYTDNVNKLKSIYKKNMKVLVRPAYRLFEIMKDKMHYFKYKWRPYVSYAINNILKCALPYDIKFETLVVQDCKMLLKQPLPKTNSVVTCSSWNDNTIPIPNAQFMIYNNFDKQEYLERMKTLEGKGDYHGYKRYTCETFIWELYNPVMTINMKEYFEKTDHMNPLTSI